MGICDRHLAIHDELETGKAYKLVCIVLDLKRAANIVRSLQRIIYRTPQKHPPLTANLKVHAYGLDGGHIVILKTCHPVRGKAGLRREDVLLYHFCCDGRDVFQYEVRCLNIEEDARRVTFGVPLDDAARWIWRIRADAGNLECRAICHTKVTSLMHDPDWVCWGDLVQILPIRHPPARQRLE